MPPKKINNKKKKRQLEAPFSYKYPYLSKSDEAELYDLLRKLIQDEGLKRPPSTPKCPRYINRKKRAELRRTSQQQQGSSVETSAPSLSSTPVQDEPMIQDLISAEHPSKNSEAIHSLEVVSQKLISEVISLKDHSTVLAECHPTACSLEREEETLMDVSIGELPSLHASEAIATEAILKQEEKQVSENLDKVSKYLPTLIHHSAGESQSLEALPNGKSEVLLSSSEASPSQSSNQVSSGLPLRSTPSLQDSSFSEMMPNDLSRTPPSITTTSLEAESSVVKPSSILCSLNRKEASLVPNSHPDQVILIGQHPEEPPAVTLLKEDQHQNIEPCQGSGTMPDPDLSGHTSSPVAQEEKSSNLNDEITREASGVLADTRENLNAESTDQLAVAPSISGQMPSMAAPIPDVSALEIPKDTSRQDSAGQSDLTIESQSMAQSNNLAESLIDGSNPDLSTAALSQALADHSAIPSATSMDIGLPNKDTVSAAPTPHDSFASLASASNGSNPEPSTSALPQNLFNYSAILSATSMDIVLPNNGTLSAAPTPQDSSVSLASASNSSNPKPSTSALSQNLFNHSAIPPATPMDIVLPNKGTLSAAPTPHDSSVSLASASNGSNPEPSTSALSQNLFNHSAIPPATPMDIVLPNKETVSATPTQEDNSLTLAPASIGSSSTEKEALSRVGLGVNLATRGLERGQLEALIVSGEAPLVVRHLIPQAVSRRVPLVLASSLGKELAAEMNLPSLLVISILKGAENSRLKELLEFIRKKMPREEDLEAATSTMPSPKRLKEEPKALMPKKENPKTPKEVRPKSTPQKEGGNKPIVIREIPDLDDFFAPFTLSPHMVQRLQKENKSTDTFLH